MRTHEVQLVGGPADGNLVVFTEDDLDELAEQLTLTQPGPHSRYSHLAPGVLYRYERDAGARPTIYRFSGSALVD